MMDLKIKDVTELLNVSESTIRRWLLDGKIPAYRLNRQYRFNRQEIEDWVLHRKLGRVREAVPFAEETLSDAAEHGMRSLQEEDELEHKNSPPRLQQFSLYRAVQRGGVYHDVPGNTKEEVIRYAMKTVAEQFTLDADVLTELLLDREALMPTALNNGIGVPHTRDFLLDNHYDVITVVFPKHPIEYGALDGQPVTTLFFLFACEDKRHLHLLAKLAHLSSNEKTRKILRSRPQKEALLKHVRLWEETESKQKPR